MASRPGLQSVSSSLCRQCSRRATHQVRHAYKSQTTGQLTSDCQFSTRVKTLPLPRLATATLPPRRLASSRSAPGSETELKADADAPSRLAQTVRDNAAPFAETYVAAGATEALFKECAAQADYIIPQVFERHGKIPKTADGEDIGEGTGWWYESMGLQPTFSSWCHITFLHMWLLMVRFRYFPDQHAGIWMQHLIDHFFFEAEHRMNLFHGVTSRALRNTYLKDVHNQWRGVQGAYDEGLIKGDAVMATAVWRNIFKGNDHVDWRKVALVVSFVRRALRGLDRAADRTIVGAMVRFGNPLNEGVVVNQPSRDVETPFSKEDEAALAEMLKAGEQKSS